MSNDANSNPGEVERRIAERAYHRWQQRGSPAGSDLDDWLEAEREVREERGSDAAAPRQAAPGAATAQVQPSRK